MAKQSGFKNLLTFDMGGTSTDVCLVENGKAQLRRETTVGDVTVRASSVDVRTVGAGGGSIAKVPELTKALRVGPESAGAVPGPAAYDRGGTLPTVTDANVVLGYLPSGEVRLGGDMKVRRDLAEKAMQTIADALKLDVKQAAAGIIDIVNENMYGALRLVSVEKGYDPRDFALIAFGGAGPLHANALGKLMNSWPVIIPPGPGVLCAYGDATTRVRDEASRTFIRRFSETSAKEVTKIFRSLASMRPRHSTTKAYPKRISRPATRSISAITARASSLTVDFEIEEFDKRGLDGIGERFDEMHKQLFTFALPHEKELVNLRAVAQGKPTNVRALRVEKGAARVRQRLLPPSSRVYVDGKDQDATLYDRSKLKSGNVIKGPAIVLEMDSTTLILPGHVGKVDDWANILITPST